jgi:hypothetical protein
MDTFSFFNFEGHVEIQDGRHGNFGFNYILSGIYKPLISLIVYKSNSKVVYCMLEILPKTFLNHQRIISICEKEQPKSECKQHKEKYFMKKYNDTFCIIVTIKDKTKK